MEQTYIVYQSKIKQLGLSFLGLLMVLVCLFITFAGLSEGKYVMLIIGLISLMFFGACEGFIVKQVFKGNGKRIVVLDKDGFYDYSSAIATKDRHILWSEVEKIENKRIMNQEFVSVYVKNSEEFLAKLSSFQRKSIKINVAMGFGEININLQSAKNCTNDQLVARMNNYLSDIAEMKDTKQEDR